MTTPDSKNGPAPLHESGAARGPEYWQAQSCEARFAEAWRLVVERELAGGKDPSELRMKRHVTRLIRRSEHPNEG